MRIMLQRASSTLPLNRPATVEGSVGKGAWCGRCWAMDTGPQKESDTSQEAKTARRESGRKRAEGQRHSRPSQRDRLEKTVIKSERGQLTVVQ